MVTPLIKGIPRKEFLYSENEISPNASVGPDVLIDKVYNFTVSKPFVNFSENLYLEKYYNYYITLSVVTPHECNISVWLWDPEDDPYYLSYEIKMEQDDYREIPYGAALTGNHSILFYAELKENMNIHIHMERGGRCLYDKIQSEEVNYIKYIEVGKFYNNTNISHTISMKTDNYYRFYFGRVSSIASVLSGRTGLLHTITDKSQGIVFGIYENDTIGSPANVTQYKFGTAVEGDYRLNLTIHINVLCVNVAYTVIEKFRIADGTDPNDDDPPIPPPPPHNGTGIEAFIPTTWTVGMIVFVGSGVLIPIILIQRRKKKNPTGI
ncbi:MAG: hypothetical protein ACFFDH_14310 [Promethearchaeota archaeon]